MYIELTQLGCCAGRGRRDLSSDSEASSASTSRSTSPIPQPPSPARIAAELKNSNLPAQVRHCCVVAGHTLSSEQDPLHNMRYRLHELPGMDGHCMAASYIWKTAR